MLINFKGMEEAALHNFYGGKKDLFAKMFADKQNRILYGRLDPGASIGTHTHETSSEIIFVLHGTGKAICDGETEALSAGSCHYCPKGCTHSLVNDSSSDLVFFGVDPQQ